MASKPTLGLIICGDRCAQARQWSSSINEVLVELSRYYEIIQVYHGACRGIDKLAGTIAGTLNIPVTAIPADWNLGVVAGPIRNREMLQRLLQLPVNYRCIIAFHPNIHQSRGSANMISQAEKAGITTQIYNK